MATKKQMTEAYASGKELLDRLPEGSRCMEQVIDRSCALFFERWLLPNGVGVVVMYAPTYRELFVECAPRTNSWEATEAAIAAAAAL